MICVMTRSHCPSNDEHAPASCRYLENSGGGSQEALLLCLRFSGVVLAYPSHCVSIIPFTHTDTILIPYHANTLYSCHSDHLQCSVHWTLHQRTHHILI